jgi:uracil-DNA glycosylase family 4
VTRCELCPNKYNCVPPSGPEDSDYVFIGEAPGKLEDQRKEVFCGPTGQEVDRHYLPLAGLYRGRCRFINAISCLPDRAHHKLDINRQADLDLLLCCASHHLLPELDRTKPRLIIPMGAFACYVISPDINLELQHGIPIETAWGTVFPLWHPAAGLHTPKKMLQIRNDFIRLGKYIKGRLHAPVDDRIPSYSMWDGSGFLDTRATLACDTEVTRFKEPWCITFSDAPGTGHMIMADDKEKLAAFQWCLDDWQGPILGHNWDMFDSFVVAEMGLRFPPVIDTMRRAFHLGNLPQGLKALCYRLLGMKMRDFDDLVTPYSTPICLEYLRAAYNEEWPKPEHELVRDPDTGLWKVYKPQSMTTKLKRFFSDYTKNPSKDPFSAWDRWESSQAMIEAKLGLWPGKSIEHVPFEKALHYACRDADGLLRLWPILEAMTRDVRKKNQEDWGDAQVLG